MPGHVEERHGAEGRGGLEREPFIALETAVLEVDARDVEREPTFFSAADGGIEIGERGLGHREAA